MIIRRHLKRRDWSEEDLFMLTKEEFLATFDVSEEEYEMFHKEIQEM